MLKLAPVRHEDLKDFKDAWDMLKTITAPGEDLIAAIETARFRKAQAVAASSLLFRLDAITAVCDEWCTRAQREPFVAAASGRAGAESAALEAAFEVRLRKASDAWD